MSALSINPPFPVFPDTDGQPLEDGYIWIGVAGLNPLTNPIVVYWDAALTLPAGQPVRTINGFPSRAGTPARLYAGSDYSIQVQNKNGSVVYSSSNATDIMSSELVTFIQAGTGAVERTAQSKMRDFVSVKDFGAVGDGVADDIAAINAAISYAKSTNNIKGIYFPTGNYLITNSIDARGSFNNGIELWGFRATITSNGDFPALRLNGRVPDTPPEVRMKAYVHGFVFQGPGKSNISSIGIEAQRGANVVVKDCQMYNYYRGLYCFGNLISNYENLYISRCSIGIEASPDGIEFAPNDLHFTNCQIVDNDKILRAINFPNGAMTFIGCELEGNNLSGNVSDGVRVIEFFNAGKVTLQGCHIEENPGEYNIYFDSNSNNHLTIVGCEIIPGDNCGNALFIASATGNPNLFVVGSRITNNDTGLGQKQINLSTGAKAVIIGPFGGNLSGDISKTILIRDGKIGTNGVLSGFAGMRAVGSSGIAYDSEGQFRFVDSSENRLGLITSSAIRKDANTEYTIGANNAADISIRRIGTNTFEPSQDNAYNLGTAAVRWKEVFAVAPVINTSDEREKQVRSEGVEIAALRAWSKVNFVQFKWKQAIEEKGEKARWHFGVIAQQVKEAFESEGLDAFAYGLLCYDEWDDFYEEKLDENGVPTGEKTIRIKAGNRYGVRYEEALALECAYLRSKFNGEL